MAQVPITRELKIMLLEWLRNGIDEFELIQLGQMQKPTEEEKREELEMIDTFLYENGECEYIKNYGRCYPDRTPERDMVWL